MRPLAADRAEHAERRGERRCSRPRPRARRGSRGRSRWGWARSSRPPECSMPWSTGQDRHVAGAGEAAASRAATAGCAGRCVERSVSTKTRSTKSGPGQVQVVARRTSAHVCSSRSSASSPSSSSRREVVMSAVVAMAPERLPARVRSRARMEHDFTGPSYTLGIEEELMIVDARDARARQRDRDAARGGRRRARSSPSSWSRCSRSRPTRARTPPRPGEQLRALRRQVARRAARARA